MQAFVDVVTKLTAVLKIRAFDDMFFPSGRRVINNMEEKRFLSACIVSTPIGPLTLAVYHHCLCHIDFGTFTETEASLSEWAKKHGLPDRPVENDGECAEAARQILGYFSGERRTFNLPLLLIGTPFQKKVWHALEEIPYGRTCSYKDIAEAVGSPKAVRAVGAANNRNPLPIVIPCHRVIGSNGSLVGYGGGLAIKRQILQMEKDTLVC